MPDAHPALEDYDREDAQDVADTVADAVQEQLGAHHTMTTRWAVEAAVLAAFGYDDEEDEDA